MKQKKSDEKSPNSDLIEYFENEKKKRFKRKIIGDILFFIASLIALGYFAYVFITTVP